MLLFQGIFLGILPIFRGTKCRLYLFASENKLQSHKTDYKFGVLPVPREISRADVKSALSGC